MSPQALVLNLTSHTHHTLALTALMLWWRLQHQAPKSRENIVAEPCSQKGKDCVHWPSWYTQNQHPSAGWLAGPKFSPLFRDSAPLQPQSMWCVASQQHGPTMAAASHGLPPCHHSAATNCPKSFEQDSVTASRLQPCFYSLLCLLVCFPGKRDSRVRRAADWGLRTQPSLLPWQRPCPAPLLSWQQAR